MSYNGEDMIGDDGFGTEEYQRKLEEDAKRFRWLLAGNGYFMEEEGLCGHGPCNSEEQDEARYQIDQAMEDQERDPLK